MRNANNLNQGRRLLVLRDYLVEHTGRESFVSLEQIMDHLDLQNVGASDRKTVYNAIRILNDEFFMGIEYNRAHNGYHITKPQFELYELRLIVDSVQSANFITEAEASSITSKIKKLADDNTKSILNRKSYVGDRIRNMKESVVEEADIIHQAITSDLKIRFRFFHYSPKKDKNYSKKGEYMVVSPYALYWNNGFYYLYAYVSEARKFKYFRIDRIEKISIQYGSRRDGRDQYKLENPTAKRTAKVFDMYRGDPYMIKLRCQNTVAGYIIDKFGKDSILIPIDESHFEVNVYAEISPPFFAWISTFGKRIKIISPEPVVKKMRAFVTKLQEIYNDEGEM